MPETNSETNTETNITHQLVVGVFADSATAQGALDKLLAARKSQPLDAPAAAIVRKDTGGAVEIKETDSIDATKGAVAGGIVGGILGLLSGKTLAGAGLGALIGGIGANYIDTGVPDDRLKQVGAALQPGAAAVVAIVADTALAQVSALLEPLGATVTSAPIAFSTDVAKSLSAGDFGAALTSLGAQAGSAVEQAGTFVSGAASSASEAVQDATQNVADAVQPTPKPAGEPQAPLATAPPGSAAG